MSDLWRGALGWIRRALWLATALYALGVLTFAAFVLIDNTDRSIVEFFKTIGWLAFWPAPVVFAACLLLRRRTLVVLLLPGMVAFALYYGPYLLPRPARSVPPEAPRLTVYSFNVQTPSQADYTAFAALFEASGADVIAIQDLSHGFAAYLDTALLATYPHRLLSPSDEPPEQQPVTNGQGVLSRYPIVQGEYWEYDDLTWRHGNQRVVIDRNGAQVVIYNVHPWPAVQWRGGRVRASSGQDFAHRETIRRLLDRIQIETLPLILVGDFNLSDQYAEYDRITRLLIDSHRAAGIGMGYTYPDRGLEPLPPLFRIDYVFHSHHFQTISMRVQPATGLSDHFPLRATLALVE